MVMKMSDDDNGDDDDDDDEEEEEEEEDKHHCYKDLISSEKYACTQKECTNRWW